MKARAICFATFACAAVLCVAAPSDDMKSAEIKAAEKSWAAALIHGDLKALGSILGDDLVYVHSSGKNDSKASYLESLRSGSLKYTSLRIDEATMEVRVFSTIGVVNESVDVESVSGGASKSMRLQLLHVWDNRNRNWQLIAHQSTLLPR